VRVDWRGGRREESGSESGGERREWIGEWKISQRQRAEGRGIQTDR
jgi:hypothetical protein